MTTRAASAATSAIRDPRWLVAMLILMFAAPLALSVAHANATDDAKRNGDDAAVREVVAGFSDAVIVSHTADFNATAPAAK